VLLDIQDTNTSDDEKRIQTKRTLVVSGNSYEKSLQHGTVAVEFVRDSNGKIQVDENNAPIVELDTNGNPKQGPILLRWNPEAYTKDGKTYGAWVSDDGIGGSGVAVNYYNIVSLGFCIDETEA